MTFNQFGPANGCLVSFYSLVTADLQCCDVPCHDTSLCTAGVRHLLAEEKSSGLKMRPGADITLQPSNLLLFQLRLFESSAYNDLLPIFVIVKCQSSDLSPVFSQLSVTHHGHHVDDVDNGILRSHPHLVLIDSQHAEL